MPDTIQRRLTADLTIAAPQQRQAERWIGSPSRRGAGIAARGGRSHNCRVVMVEPAYRFLRAPVVE
ncbi:hypothetical protein QP150_04950 [Sphingomonas sp. 22L2VL55-3]